jgi:hypothetical protein
MQIPAMLPLIGIGSAEGVYTEISLNESKYQSQLRYKPNKFEDYAQSLKDMAGYEAKPIPLEIIVKNLLKNKICFTKSTEMGLDIAQVKLEDIIVVFIDNHPVQQLLKLDPNACSMFLCLELFAQIPKNTKMTPLRTAMFFDQFYSDVFNEMGYHSFSSVYPEKVVAIENKGIFFESEII